jgi:hypothetical protein
MARPSAYLAASTSLKDLSVEVFRTIYISTQMFACRETILLKRQILLKKVYFQFSGRHWVCLFLFQEVQPNAMPVD